MDENAGASRLSRLQSLRQKRADGSSQNVAAAGRAQRRIRGRVDVGRPVGKRDDCAGALEDDDSARLGRKTSGDTQSVLRDVRDGGSAQPGHLARVRGQHASSAGQARDLRSPHAE